LAVKAGELTVYNAEIIRVSADHLGDCSSKTIMHYVLQIQNSLLLSTISCFSKVHGSQSKDQQLCFSMPSIERSHPWALIGGLDPPCFYFFIFKGSLIYFTLGLMVVTLCQISL